jgi:hypothetical protein
MSIERTGQKKRRPVMRYTPEAIASALRIFIKSGSANGNEEMRRHLLKFSDTLAKQAASAPPRVLPKSMCEQTVRKVLADYEYVTPPHLRDSGVLADRIVEAIASTPSHELPINAASQERSAEASSPVLGEAGKVMQSAEPHTSRVPSQEAEAPCEAAPPTIEAPGCAYCMSCPDPKCPARARSKECCGEWDTLGTRCEDCPSAPAPLAGETPETDLCDACGGTGKPVSGLKCMCGGSGKMSDAARYLRERVVELERELAERMPSAIEYKKGDPAGKCSVCGGSIFWYVSHPCPSSSTDGGAKT